MFTERYFFRHLGQHLKNHLRKKLTEIWLLSLFGHHRSKAAQQNRPFRASFRASPVIPPGTSPHQIPDCYLRCNVPILHEKTLFHSSTGNRKDHPFLHLKRKKEKCITSTTVKVMHCSILSSYCCMHRIAESVCFCVAIRDQNPRLFSQSAAISAHIAVCGNSGESG